MKQIPDLLCRNCPCWIQLTDIMQNQPIYGSCSKAKSKSLIRYYGSSCIVDEDGNVL